MIMQLNTTNAECRLRALVGHRFDELCEQSDLIAVFGSRAVGCHTSMSDLDVLVVGGAWPRFIRGVDLICVTRSRFESQLWLESELGTHIARYGHIVHGNWPCLGETRIGAHAVARKRHMILARTSAVEAVSRRTPISLARHCRSLSRDLSRLRLLEAGLPVPPTAVVDTMRLTLASDIIDEFSNQLRVSLPSWLTEIAAHSED